MSRQYDKTIISVSGNPKKADHYFTQMGVSYFDGCNWWTSILKDEDTNPEWYLLPVEGDFYPKDFIVWLMGKDSVERMYKRYLNEKN